MEVFVEFLKSIWMMEIFVEFLKSIWMFLPSISIYCVDSKQVVLVILKPTDAHLRFLGIPVLLIDECSGLFLA